MIKALPKIILGLFLIPVFTILFSQIAFADAICEPSEQASVDLCVEACPEGEQSCINDCCETIPECECPEIEEDSCTQQNEADLNECTDSCDPGDQSCIDSCCFDWPDCPCPEIEEDSCTQQDEADLNECTDSCDPGDQSCIDSCCFDWPDCPCPELEEDSCTQQDEADLNECTDSCDPGDQSCIDSCCFDWPDCPCPGTEEEPCIDQLMQCHMSCTDVQCFKNCDGDFECSSCNSYFHCLNNLCDSNDEECKQSCTDNYPECTEENPPEDYSSCYDDCFEYYTDYQDVLACIDGCQEEYPDPDLDKPYELKEPRCFVQTNFFDYEDVPAAAWFWAPINFLTRLEIPEGNGTGINSATFHSRIVRGYNRDDEDDSKLKPGKIKDIFLPNRDLNRFEASKIAVLVSCFTIPDTQTDIPKNTTYSDLETTSDEYMNRVVYRASEVGLVQGYEDSSFKPFQPITRAEFLKLFLTVGEFDVHSQTYSTSGFTDVTNPDDWYYPYIAFAKQNSIPIIGGYDDGTFRPNNPIQRSEAMMIITNVMFALDWISK